MIVDEQDLLEALTRLELEGGDCLDLEAKTFSEYSRDALGPTLSAFANLPGGGTLLLGVSENPVEEHQLLIRHQRPRGDTIPIPNTSINNLDADLVKGFVRNARAGSTALRDQSDAEVLLNLNILTEEGSQLRWLVCTPSGAPRRGTSLHWRSQPRAWAMKAAQEPLTDSGSTGQSANAHCGR